MKKRVKFEFDDRSLETFEEMLASTGLKEGDFVKVSVIRNGISGVVFIPRENSPLTCRAKYGTMLP